MDHPHHRAHLVIGVTAAALAAVLGFHFLFFSHTYGFAFALFLLILAGAVIGLFILGGRQGNTWAFMFLVPLLLSLGAEALYASEVVRLLGFIVSCASFALFAYWLTAPPVRFWSVRSLWPGAMLSETIFPFPWFKGFFHALVHGKSDIRRVAIGAVLAVPFLVVIGLLFVSSDLLLQQTLNEIFDGELIGRFLRRGFWDLVAAIFFVSAGWAIITRIVDVRRAKEPAQREGIDHVIVTTFLTFLNALFIAFIVYQFYTLMSGVSVLESRGITYSAYAREGFFQLLAVSVIVFVTLCGIYAFTGYRSWSVRLLSASLIVETGFVIASALRRMALYIDAYGVTLQRVWSTYAIILIAVAFVVLLVGMFSRAGYAQVLKCLAVGSLVVVSLSLLVNVEDMIVRFNFNRFIRGQAASVDLEYLKYDLSSDSLPALVEYSLLQWPNENVTSARDRVLYKLDTASDRAVLIAFLHAKEDDLRADSLQDPWALVISDYRALSAIGALPK